MAAFTRITILILAISIAKTSALEPRKVLNIPEKIIGGVIDIVQSHKNKPAQQVNYQQSQQVQQVYQQAYPQPYPPYQPWNTNSVFQSTIQSQNQGQYGNYVYPSNGNYPTNSGQQFQGQYPVNSQGNFQTQGQVVSNGQSSQHQTQGQTGFQGQYGQSQEQNQQTGQYHNTNQPSNFQGSGQQNFQGSGGNQQSFLQGSGTNQNFQGSSGNQQSFLQGSGTNQNIQGAGGNQQSFLQGSGSLQNVQGTGGNHQSFQGSFGSHQNFQGSSGSQQTGFQQNQPSTSFAGPNQGGFVSQSNYGQTFGTTYPQGIQSGFVHQTSQFQKPSQIGSGSNGFQAPSGQHTGPGPTCVCQAWTKPKEERSEALNEPVEKIKDSETK